MPRPPLTGAAGIRGIAFPVGTVGLLEGREGVDCDSASPPRPPLRPFDEEAEAEAEAEKEEEEEEEGSDRSIDGPREGEKLLYSLDVDPTVPPLAPPLAPPVSELKEEPRLDEVSDLRNTWSTRLSKLRTGVGGG